MKQLVVISIAVLLLIAGILSLEFLVFNRGGRKITTPHDYSFLRNGDLVLRRGRSVESFAVCILDKNRDYSHIGIVCIENKVPYIIHIVPDQPDRVRKDLPEIFLSNGNASHFKVLRSDFETEKLKKVSEAASGFFNRKFTFDNKYDLSTDTVLYCTELIIKAFKYNNITFPDIFPQNIKLLTGSYKIIMPGSFLENSHFTSVMDW